jgi:hypothetical protein
MVENKRVPVEVRIWAAKRTAIFKKSQIRT